MAVGKASVVELDMYNLVGVGCRLTEVGPVLGIVSCEDPQNMRFLVFHVVDSPLDEFA